MIHIWQINITRHSCKRIIKGQLFFANLLFTYKVTFYIFTIVTITWLSVLSLLAGDIRPNPGPLSTSSTSSIPDTSWTYSSVVNFSNLSNHLSFVHYNVQSLVPKLDILGTELFEFDILAFSETWLNPSVPSQDLHIQTFRQPKRKDSHGGVTLYVKKTFTVGEDVT